MAVQETDENVYEDVDVVDEASDATDEVVDDAEETADDAEDTDVTPDELDPEFVEWIRTQDPKAVRKTFEKFTNKWDEVLSKEKQLSPLEELRKGLEEDPGLVAHIERYYNEDHQDEASDAKIASLEKRLGDFQAVVQTERALESLHAQAAKDGLPDFDDGELLDFAAANRIGTLDVAYKALMADEIVAARVKAREDEIKANAKAKVEVRPKGAGSGPAPVTLADLESMSDADFLARNRK